MNGGWGGDPGMKMPEAGGLRVTDGADVTVAH